MSANKALEDFRGFLVGHFGLANWGDKIATVAQAVHDGDTVNVRALGNFGTRLIGIDTPELSIELTINGKSDFIGLNRPEWETFLSDPFDPAYGVINLDSGLETHLRGRLQPGKTATNHRRHAELAHGKFEELIKQDLEASEVGNEDFRFYLAFAYEAADRYGRLLCFLNREEKDANKRPLSYNLRQLEAGVACPYSIWPNINPSRRTGLADIDYRPTAFRQLLTADPTMSKARGFIAACRQARAGIFEANDPLILEPFEIRFLAGRRAPDRWLIDLGAAVNDNSLIPPQQYHHVSNSEDRLWIPKEHLIWFERTGWQRV